MCAERGLVMNWKDDSKFPGRLRQVREKAGLSQSEFAERVGVSRGAISTYELGDRVPDIRFVDKVIEEFGCSYDYLMGRAEAMQKESSELSKNTGLNDAAINIIMRFAPEINALTAAEPSLFRDLILIPAIYAMGTAYYQLLGSALKDNREKEIEEALKFFAQGNHYWERVAHDFFERAKQAGYEKLDKEDRERIREIVSEAEEGIHNRLFGKGTEPHYSEAEMSLLSLKYERDLNDWAILDLMRLERDYSMQHTGTNRSVNGSSDE